MVQNEKKSVCRPPYLKNHTSYDFHLWYILMCKMITSTGTFFIFSKFWFSRLLGGSKDKKWPKKTKNCHALYLRNNTSYDLHLWYTCNRILSSGFFTFIPNFFKFFWRGVNSGVKGQKMAQMTKNYVCRIPYLRKHTSYGCDFWYTCVKWQHLQVLFLLF